MFMKNLENNFCEKSEIREEALKRFHGGELKKRIYKDLNISPVKLNMWIRYEGKTVKKTALDMYFNLEPGIFSSENLKNTICNKLNIPEKQLNSWINERYGIKNDNITVSTASRHVQNGFSLWFDSIIFGYLRQKQ